MLLRRFGSCHGLLFAVQCAMRAALCGWMFMALAPDARAAMGGTASLVLAPSAAWPAGALFQFDLTVRPLGGSSLDGTYAYTNSSGAAGTVTFSDGEASVAGVANGGTFTIEGLPAGAAYTVTETGLSTDGGATYAAPGTRATVTSAADATQLVIPLNDAAGTVAGYSVGPTVESVMSAAATSGTMSDTDIPSVPVGAAITYKKTTSLGVTHDPAADANETAAALSQMLTVEINSNGGLDFKAGQTWIGVDTTYKQMIGSRYLLLAYPASTGDASISGALLGTAASVSTGVATSTVRFTNVLPTGVTVNGADAALGSGGEGATAWTYAASNLTLSGAGPYVLSGTNTDGAVQVVVPDGKTPAVTVSNLVLVATNDSACAFQLNGNAKVTLTLAGTNSLTSGKLCAGLQVPSAATLSITNAVGANDDSLLLTAIGGISGAGIGGSSQVAGGTVTIFGGTVVATGGSCGAGIGGGLYGAGGTVTIFGGTVATTGGGWGAGIGGGSQAAGGTVTISGGTVVATGKSGGQDVGRGRQTDPEVAVGSLTVTGGSLNMANGAYAPNWASNLTANVYCVTVGVAAVSEAVTVTGPEGYGTNDIWSDAKGRVYLWFPNGTNAFAAADGLYTATVSGGTATIEPAELVITAQDPETLAPSAWTPDIAATTCWSTNLESSVWQATSAPTNVPACFFRLEIR